MKYQGNSPQQLEKEYLTRAASIEASAMAILNYIEKTKQADQPITWGEVGSLGYVNEELANLVKFLGA